MDSEAQVVSKPHRLELQRATECEFEKVTSETYDPRFDVYETDSSFEPREWDVYKENNVANII